MAVAVPKSLKVLAVAIGLLAVAVLTAFGSDQTFTTTFSAAPSVSTGSASSVTTSSARVSGTVNPQGSPTSYTFQYGTSTSYGAQTSSTSAGYARCSRRSTW